VLSAAQTLAVGADEDEVRRRAAATGDDPAEVREAGLGGTPAEVVDKLGRLGELGASRVYLQVIDLQDLDHLHLVADEVVPLI
jgi:alkanesulfonate monooxygenase SsuD/methylene tetrahydromethanopterin reductase-like flavin-dependent oxidoreductase (luciferase family)